MLKRLVVAAGCLAAMGASAQIFGALPTAQIVEPAYAQQGVVDFKHTLNLADRERLLSQKMSKELLLVALGYNKKENLRNLNYTHDMFSRVLKGLHYGDAELGLEATRDPDVLERLSRVEELWPLFDSALQDSIAQGHVLRDHVEVVADLGLPLLRAMDNTVEGFEELDARTSESFSLFDHLIAVAGRQRMLTQKMTTEFLLIAYGHSAAINRKRLAQSMADFEKVMNGLIFGDPTNKVLAAPNKRILAQLRAVERLWQDFKPLMQSAVAGKGKEVDEDLLSHVASLNVTLLTEMDSAVSMYEAM